MIATTIEQTKRLLEAGIDPRTVDMYWTDLVETTESGRYFTKESDDVFLYSDHVVPAWSLSALITLCPEHVPYRIIRTRGKDIEGIFEDLVEFLCKEK